MGAFAYSDEEGTYSNLRYDDNIPYEIKQQRVSEIMKIQQQISLEINQQKIGKSFKIIVDSLDDDYYIARSEYDSPEVDTEILINRADGELLIGEFYTAKIIGAEEFDLYAQIQK